ncbi:6-phosphogluconolactonase [Thiohalophilus sp.]|uniref:6-phosphogluconolactonase n=1 Tax=Thiohalophilus sp. TaxID=3028392 RepID=UPI002ACD2434|nr:6-phosphogluconolactonase [Thiohalophilus sp.]MDZ7662670.1 6-phosphogluconolactonase [Thiohalophilus sp.]
MKSQYHYQIYLEPGQLERAATRRWVELARESIRARNSFHVALAGGSTPKPVYHLLQQEELEWDKVHLYWGDERDVPADHPESNYLMVKEALIDHVPIPVDNVHPIGVQADIEKSVEEYRQVLGNVHRSPNGLPCFDLVMLGMGDDGHIASLFPESSALTVADTAVVSVYVEKLNSWRVTLTYPVLNAARNLMLLVTGEAKAPIVAQVLGGDGDENYPVQKLAPQGRAEWYLDQAAASQLSEST